MPQCQITTPVDTAEIVGWYRPHPGAIKVSYSHGTLPAKNALKICGCQFVIVYQHCTCGLFKEPMKSQYSCLFSATASGWQKSHGNSDG